MSEEELQDKQCHCCDECDCEECHCGEEEKCCENCTCAKRQEKCSCEENGCTNCECEECECDECDCCEQEECDCSECDCNSCESEECNFEECSQHDCSCQEECECEVCEESACPEEDLANKYLNLAKQVQADFDNFRRRSIEENKQAKLSGQISVLDVFLPCLDTFKEAKKSITDENVLKGVVMIENKINDALKEIGVEKIETIGQVYNPHLHNVIAVMKNPDEENDIILEEFQAGYKLNEKIIRYAKVIVNKKED